MMAHVGLVGSGWIWIALIGSYGFIGSDGLWMKADTMKIHTNDGLRRTL